MTEQPPTPTPSEAARAMQARMIATRPRLTRTCAHCGAEFETITPHGKFCNVKCRVNAHYARTHPVKN
jgi:NADH pyrophosphatase NudC (nudix superfamily)